MNLKDFIKDFVKRDLNAGREVSKLQLLLMRIIYLLTFFSLGYSTWSEVINPSETWGAYDGVTYSFWVAYATLMGLGIRFPIKMLPLLLLQIFYKSVWLIGIAYPMWSTGTLDATSEGFLKPFLIAIPIDLIVIPWLYVWKNYIRAIFKFKTEQYA
ncbi:hypothetical protein [uncultured Aquimarina sp.]|uniref:hypothetical protein n=1 Tax=uncultured Aquimarina sp. TaxID=575652 RepID=UPI002633968E|nr:hypothetical protein [uncultured Aquimarina sp.]